MQSSAPRTGIHAMLIVTSAFIVISLLISRLVIPRGAARRFVIRAPVFRSVIYTRIFLSRDPSFVLKLPSTVTRGVALIGYKIQA